jgi:hypothetical protein
MKLGAPSVLANPVGPAPVVHPNTEAVNTFGPVGLRGSRCSQVQLKGVNGQAARPSLPSFCQPALFELAANERHAMSAVRVALRGRSSGLTRRMERAHFTFIDAVLEFTDAWKASMVSGMLSGLGLAQRIPGVLGIRRSVRNSFNQGEGSGGQVRTDRVGRPHAQACGRGLVQGVGSGAPLPLALCTGNVSKGGLSCNPLTQ